MYKFFFKRFFDLTISFVSLLILSPLLILISIIIFFQFEGPIFFKQLRAGMNGKPFLIIKFRTMVNDFNAKGLSESEAISYFGNFLRKTSLDELPELFNILKGQMSIIGPRPLLIKYNPRYSKYHLKRLDVRPGLTGLAQISGRNSLSWTQKFDKDVEYLQNISFLNDSKIFFKTFVDVFNSKNINSIGNKHMPEFTGYDD